MEQKTLLAQTFELIDRTDVRVVTICRANDITPRWYYKLLAGDIPEPGVNRVQRIHDYLQMRESM